MNKASDESSTVNPGGPGLAIRGEDLRNFMGKLLAGGWRAITGSDTDAREMGARPVFRTRGVSTRDERPPAQPSSRGERARLQPADGPVPPGAGVPLLSDARLAARRGGRDAGDDAGRLAG